MPTPSPTPVLIELVGDSAPWWESPFIVGLSGAIVGAAAALLGSWQTTRAQNRREMRAEIMTEYEKLHTAHLTFIELAMLTNDGDLQHGSQVIALIQEVIQHIRLARWNLELIAPTAGKAAEKYQQAVELLEDSYWGEGKGKRDESQRPSAHVKRVNAAFEQLRTSVSAKVKLR